MKTDLRSAENKFTWEMVDDKTGEIIKRFKSEDAAKTRLAMWDRNGPSGMSIRPVQSENPKAVRAGTIRF